MRLNPSLLLLALGLSTTGCLATADDPETIGTATQAGTGTGLNGMKTAVFWENVYQYAGNLTAVAADSNGVLSNDFANNNITSPTKKEFYNKALQLTSAIDITNEAQTVVWPGYGYTAQEGWPVGRVTDPARVSQILAVLAAFVNDNTTHIHIGFTGSFITSTMNMREFDIKEAFIIMKPDSTSIPTRYVPHVWINPALSGFCDIDTYKLERYCEGKMEDACEFQFHTDPDDGRCVTVADGSTECDGMPALQTFLSSADIHTQVGCE